MRAIATHFILVNVAIGILVGHVVLHAADKLAEHVAKKLGRASS